MIKNPAAKFTDDDLFDLELDDPQWVSIAMARRDARDEIVDPATGLTSTETAVAQAYMLNLSISDAARDTHHSQNVTKTILNRLRVKKYIAEKTLAREEFSVAENREILGQLTDIALSDIRTLVDDEGKLVAIRDLPPRTARALKSVKVVTRPGPPDENGRPTVERVHEYAFWDKLSALDKLAKHRGLLADGLSDQVSANDIERRRLLRQELLGMLGDLAKPARADPPLTITQDGSEA